MREIRDSGVTLFYVSHAAASVRKMCSRVLVLEDGKLGFDGDVDEGIHYLKYDSDDEEQEGEELDDTGDDDEEMGADI
jgi:ABC-2 type transport system ATP-binding protein